MLLLQRYRRRHGGFSRQSGINQIIQTFFLMCTETRLIQYIIRIRIQEAIGKNGRVTMLRQAVHD